MLYYNQNHHHHKKRDNDFSDKSRARALRARHGYDKIHRAVFEPFSGSSTAHQTMIVRPYELEMRERDGITADRVESIRVEVAKHAYDRLVFQIPRTGLEGNFNLQLEWDAQSSPDASLPGIFTAVQEQLDGEGNTSPL